MPICRSRGDKREISRSPTKMSPSSSSSRPAIMRMSVVLPLPEGPSRQSNSPSATSRLNPSNSRAAPKRLAILRSDTFAKTCVSSPPLAWTPLAGRLLAAIRNAEGSGDHSPIGVLFQPHYAHALQDGDSGGRCGRDHAPAFGLQLLRFSKFFIDFIRAAFPALVNAINVAHNHSRWRREEPL